MRGLVHAPAPVFTVRSASRGVSGVTRCTLTLLAISQLLFALLPRVAAAQTLQSDPAVQRFMAEMQAKHGWSRSRLTEIFGHAEVRQSVLEAISRPAEAKPWYRYRPIFLTPGRVAGGVEFWRSHASTLSRAEREYGVPPEFIVAIIGVETRYGRHRGKTPVLDALVTLGFRYSRRAKFFLSELEQFLLLVHEEHLDPFTLMGSYAGAMGVPQFIPSSYRRYAVDFDADNVRDLIGSDADAIGSVANYLSTHGWRGGEPAAVPVKVSGARFRSMLDKGLEPVFGIAELQNAGVEFIGDSPRPPTAALLELELEDGFEYWVGFQNFYTITRYNHSALYAMAVLQLAQAIHDAYAAGDD